MHPMYIKAPKALLAMRMTCNHDNLVRFRVGAQTGQVAEGVGGSRPIGRR